MGDLTFNFGAGDPDTGEELGVPWPSYSAQIGDGQTVWVNRVIRIAKAPRRLWAAVVGTDDDTYLFAPFCTLGSRPAPGGPSTGHAEQEACEQASVWSEFDTWENGEFKSGLWEFPFTLSTGDFGVAFDVHGRLRVNAVAGASFKMLAPKGILSPVATILEPGRPAVVGWERNRVELVALGPDGAVYHKPMSAEAPSLPRGQRMRLNGQIRGPVTAVASGADRLSLFAVAADGAILHRTCGGAGVPAQE